MGFMKRFHLESDQSARKKYLKWVEQILCGTTYIRYQEIPLKYIPYQTPPTVNTWIQKVWDLCGWSKLDTHKDAKTPLLRNGRVPSLY